MQAEFSPGNDCRRIPQSDPFQCSFFAKSDGFLTRFQRPAKATNFTFGATRVQKPHMLLTCFTCSSSVKTCNFICIYAASTSRRIHAKCLQPNEVFAESSVYCAGIFVHVIKLRVTSLAGRNATSSLAISM